MPETYGAYAQTVMTGEMSYEQYWADDAWVGRFLPDPDPTPAAHAAATFCTEVLGLLGEPRLEVLLHAERLSSPKTYAATYPGTGLRRILVLSDRWEQFTPDDQAGTLIHEAVHMTAVPIHRQAMVQMEWHGVPPAARGEASRQLSMAEEALIYRLDPWLARGMDAAARWERHLQAASQ